MRERLPASHSEWAPSAAPSRDEQAVLRRYMSALERGDLAAMAQLLAEDVPTSMPPWPMWFHGRDSVIAALTASWDPVQPDYVGQFRTLETRTNMQPAVAGYTRRPGDADYTPFAVSVLQVEHSVIVEIVAFHDLTLFPAFGLPPTLPRTQ
jgi:RNA polymerase sigma-70 factor (ECF subfamily)